ncbi:MAG TPA: hypothetical protein VFG10_09795 [Saprospiraceae bacterium]|nr:hypothetical protein [Saprospiraceae bacterium]
MRWKYKQEIDIRYENPGITDLREILFQLNGPYVYPSKVDNGKYIVLQCKSHDCRDKIGKVKVYVESAEQAFNIYPKCRLCNWDMMVWKPVGV